MSTHSADVTLDSDDGPAGDARVLLVAGEGHLAMYPLVPGQELLIGRGREADVQLVHPKVSRRHARIHAGDDVVVEDLRSKNGIRLAGRRLEDSERVTLDVGANVQLGPYVAVVLESGRRGDDEPVRAALPIRDPTARGLPEVVQRVAAGGVSVLITGETGAGKEVLARSIHELSGRPGQMVAINCASLTEALLESELFGHERGAFTGAAGPKPGLFEVASGGTVFLDELGELPPGLQAKLLRVLETRVVYRVGGVKPITLDVRFVAATNRDLAVEVARGAFRRDLYFRVNGISLLIQPLRARREAIPRLAEELLAIAAAPGRPPRLGSAVLERLLRHDWPGNVRELRTVMERAAVVCDGDELTPAHILLDGPAAASPPPPAAVLPFNSDDPERDRLLAALAECAGNQTHAARLLGMSRTTFVQKLAVHRIPRPRKPRP